MKNHTKMNLLTKLKLMIKYRCKITSAARSKSLLSLRWIRQDFEDFNFYIGTKRNSQERAVFDHLGNDVIPFSNTRLIDIYFSNLYFYDKNKGIHFLIDVSKEDCYVNPLLRVRAIDNNEKPNTLDIQAMTGHVKFKKYIFIPMGNRYNVYDMTDGSLICDKVIDFKQYLTKGEDTYFGSVSYSLALRFEDGFGILVPGDKIKYCDAIVNLNDKYAPYLIGHNDKSGKMFYNFVTKYGEIITDYDIINVVKSECKDTYLCKVRKYDKNDAKFSYSAEYVFLDEIGSVINNEAYHFAYPIKANRTFVKKGVNSGYILMNKLGRKIKEHQAIHRVIKHFEKMTYGGFNITLARVILEENGKEVYIDKEFNIYPDIDDAIIS